MSEVSKCEGIGCPLKYRFYRYTSPIEARGYPEWMDERLAKVWNARCNLISMQLWSPDNELLKESITLLTEYIFPNGVHE